MSHAQMSPKHPKEKSMSAHERTDVNWVSPDTGLSFPRTIVEQFGSDRRRQVLMGGGTYTQVVCHKYAIRIVL